MTDRCTLHFARLSPQALFDPSALLEALRGASGQLPGLLSLTIWRAEEEPDRWLGLLHHDTEEHRAETLAAVVEHPFFEVLNESIVEVPDVRVVAVDAANGEPPGFTSVGDWLSLVVHDSMPGDSVYTAREALQIARDLESVPGWLGSVIGHNAANETEVYNLAFWREREGMQAEAPLRFDTTVRILRRIY